MIANTFYDFFANVAENFAKGISRTRKSPMAYLGSRNGHLFCIAPVIPLEISDIISLLKIGKSIGPNSIPIELLTILSPHIYPLLSDIIKESFLCSKVLFLNGFQL